MKESIDYLRQLNATRTREPWKPIGPFGNTRRWEMRTPDLGGKHDWPTRLFESVEGQTRPQDATDFAFIAALANNADELLEAHRYAVEHGFQKAQSE
jgi:hypothetical protein